MSSEAVVVREACVAFYAAPPRYPASSARFASLRGPPLPPHGRLRAPFAVGKLSPRLRQPSQMRHGTGGSHERSPQRSGQRIFCVHTATRLVQCSCDEKQRTSVPPKEPSASTSISEGLGKPRRIVSWAGHRSPDGACPSKTMAQRLAWPKR